MEFPQAESCDRFTYKASRPQRAALHNRAAVAAYSTLHTRSKIPARPTLVYLQTFKDDATASPRGLHPRDFVFRGSSWWWGGVTTRTPTRRPCVVLPLDARDTISIRSYVLVSVWCAFAPTRGLSGPALLPLSFGREITSTRVDIMRCAYASAVSPHAAFMVDKHDRMRHAGRRRLRSSRRWTRSTWGCRGPPVLH